MALGPVGKRIEQKLTEALAPVELRVRDDSHLHEGHSGCRPEGETHFHVRIVSNEFTGHKPIERHRMINSVLAEELRDRVHALTISAKPPE